MSARSGKFTRDSLGLAFTQYLVRAMSMARGFVAAKMLDPMAFGAWNALQLMMDYGSLAPFGTQQGLDQMVPGRLVEGDPQRIARVKRAALFNVVAFSLTFAVLGLAWASIGSSRMRESWHLSGLVLALACVMLVNVANVGTSILRSHGDIGSLSRWFQIQGLVGSGLGLLLMFWLGRWGLLWGWLAGCLVAFLYVVRRGREVFPLVPRPSVDGLDLVQIGLPLYLFMASSLVMRNLDRIVVLRFLGTQSLGYYGLSVNVLTLLMAIPDSLVYVSYPQFVKRYSEAGQDASVLHDRVSRLARGITLGLPLVAGLCAIGCPALVHTLLPKYDPCVGAMRTLGFGATGIALSSLASIVLMTVGRRVILIPAAIFLTALSGGLQVLSLRWNGGLTGIATASAIAYLVSGGVLLALAAASMAMNGRRVASLVSRCLAPTVVASALLMAVDRFILGRVPHEGIDLLLRLAFASLVYVAAYAALVLPFARGIGLLQLASESQVPWLARIARRFSRRPEDPTS